MITEMDSAATGRWWVPASSGSAMLAIVDDVAIYLDTAGVAAAVIGDAAVEEHWDEASALRDMSVAGLAGHLARSILLTEPFLDEEPADGAPLSVVDYYLAGDEPTDFDSRANRRILETGEATAAGGPAALRLAVNDSLQGLRRRLPNEDHNAARMWFGRVTTTRTVLQARTLEMLVHVDDSRDQRRSAHAPPPSVCAGRDDPGARRHGTVPPR